MKLKKAFAIIGTFLILLACFVLYLLMDLTMFPIRESSISQEYQDNKWLHIEDKLKQLENELYRHSEAVGKIDNAMKKLVPRGTETFSKKNDTIVNINNNNNLLNHPWKSAVSEMIYEKNCPITLDFAPNTDVQMLEMYKELKFDNPDGGVWKQGWKIEINENQWNRNHKLKVFVVPHSHNDPGWIKTVDEYYTAQTKHILDNMVIKLPEDRRRKFIWAEISYFMMWWNEQDDTNKDKVINLIKHGQLEFVTGGWVMNDEANSHWLSIMYQMTEGHQWLQKHLNYTPHSSWSIDPFGMSPTQAVLLKEMGLQNLLIQRIHYSVKKELASHKQLEFRWKQLWDTTGDTELFTHAMPFYSYDVPHTCGPDPKICCQFDFKRLPGHGLNCPWRIAPQPITETNVAQKALLLLDQYRKKSQLYRTNVVLAPLGDDFRYDHPTEWDVQYNNYQELFNHMNANPSMFVEAKFGTLSDYFNAVHEEKSNSDFPTLTGDFFTYADRDDHYWSGYYTSRPFYKRMDRVLLSYMRAAEIILTLATHSKLPGSDWVANKNTGLEKFLIDARRSLSIFQHHDGITGTAKDHVVIDYGQKMYSALVGTQHVIQQCTNLLLSGPGAEIPSSEIVYYNVDDIRHSQDKLPERQTITIGPELSSKKVVIYNSLTLTRHEVVTFVVSTPYIKVLNLRGNLIKCQISPIFEHGSTMSTSRYEVAFIANLPPLSLVSYIIQAVTKNDILPETTFSQIKILNQYTDVQFQFPSAFPDIEVSPSSREFSIQNSRVTAAFSNLGLLKAMKIGIQTFPVHLDFASYGVRKTAEKSGAYLFLPDGDARPVQIENTVVKVIEGPIFSSVIVQLPFVLHTVSLYNSPGADSLGLEITNLVDIAQTANFELVMRLSTNINNTNEFFTDLNGYQIIRRKRLPKLPIQANYYPIPTMAYLEDRQLRLTIATGSPLGCGSLKEGQIEVMMDRRLIQDDNRGLAQGVTDNHPTKHVFRILLEKKTHKCQTTAENHPAGFPTLSAHVASQTLLNPLIRLLRNDDTDVSADVGYSPSMSEFGADYSMAVLRTGIRIKNKDDYTGLILQRHYLDVCYVDRVLLQQFPLSQGSVNIKGLFLEKTDMKMNKASLSFLFLEELVDFHGDHQMCPMEVQAYVLND